MPEESAVIDAVPDLSAPESPDTSAPETHSPEVTETPETQPGESPEVEGQQPAAEVDPATSQKPVYDPATKKLDPAVKAELDKMRETNPVLAARIRNSLAQGEALRAVLPGGVKEAQQLKSTLEDLGGEEGIQELRGLGDEFNSLIEAYNGNDPKFIDELVNANAESFQKLAPGIMDKFAEIDPGGFGSYVSRVLINDMRNNDIPMHMRLLAKFTDSTNASALESLKAVSDYLTGVEELAKKPVVNPIAKKEPDSREIELNKKEENFRRGEWKSVEERKHFQTFNSTLTGLLGDRKLSAEDRQTLNGWYKLKMEQLIPKGFNEKVEKYFKSNDQKGYQRYLESWRKDAVPAALKYAVEKVVPANGKRPAAPPAPTAPKPGTPIPKADAGFKMISKPPQHNDINTRLTSTDMIRARKAVLIDGTKVQW